MLTRCLATAAITFTFSLSAHSAPLSDAYQQECQRVENSAKAIMNARQSGVPLTTMLDTADESAKQSEYVGSLYKALIGKAYDLPRMSTKSEQQKMVADFQKTYYSLCIDTAQKTASKNT